MKKLLAVLSVLFILVGCTDTKKSTSSDTNNSVSEKLENTAVSITSLNGKKTDMSEYVLLNDKDNSFLKVSIEEAMKLFNEKGTGLVYIGYSECPWCNRVVPVLNKVGKEAGIPIYYIDVKAEDVTKEGVTDLLKAISNILEKDKNGNPSFFVPEVVAIKDGEIKGHHLATVESYEDPSKDMSEEQEKELKDIYFKLIESMK